ncbi:MAG: hypothetical protein NTU44_01995 [Bacteroidetes bacterium]|nr:hypothetical protein [Bacteroidota bacterium]
MDKKINIRRLLLLLLVLLAIHSYSQELFTKEMKWDSCDSIAIPNFQDSNQIIEWGKSISPIACVDSKKISIKNTEVFILEVDQCSGIYCLSIYVFVIRNNFWRLITSSNVRLNEQMIIKVDDNREKIIFRTKSGQIGELLFETLNSNFNK